MHTMLLATILLCAVGLLLIVYRYDMYEREPWYMLALALGLGAGAGWVLGYAEDAILTLFEDGRGSPLVEAAVASSTEELAKLLIVVGIWFAIPWHFNDPADGLIYGALVGLGFAVEESLFYISLDGRQPPWPAVAGRETVRLFFHLLLGGLTCVGLGLARFRIPSWPAVLVGGVAASIALHFCWDYFCGLPARTGTTSALQRPVSIAVMLASLLLFAAAVTLAVKHSGDAHPPKHLRSLWGWPFRRSTDKRKLD